MKKLVKLEPVIHPGVKDLIKLYDTVESHVRSLSSLGINYQYFGPLLIWKGCLLRLSYKLVASRGNKIGM